MRPIKSAEILAVGTELTTGTTRDTNPGEVAGDKTARGVRASDGGMWGYPKKVKTRATEERNPSDLLVSPGGWGREARSPKPRNP